MSAGLATLPSHSRAWVGCGGRLGRALAALAVVLCAAAGAQPLSPTPAAPQATFTPQIDAQLPLALPLIDAHGRAARLGDAFSARPVILVLGYYRCPQLCGLLMHGVLEALYTAGLPRDDYRIVDVSIDPHDTPAIALAREQAYRGYADFLAGSPAPASPLDLRLYTATPAAIDALARRVGFHYQATADDGAARFAHPAGLVVLTPQGHIARYLMGVRFDAGELRDALRAAADGRTGDSAGSSLGTRIALLCAHVDPRYGHYDNAVLQGMRALSLAVVLLIGLGLWQLVKGTRDTDEHRH